MTIGQMLDMVFKSAKPFKKIEVGLLTLHPFHNVSIKQSDGIFCNEALMRLFSLVDGHFFSHIIIS